MQTINVIAGEQVLALFLGEIVAETSDEEGCAEAVLEKQGGYIFEVALAGIVEG